MSLASYLPVQAITNQGLTRTASSDLPRNYYNEVGEMCTRATILCERPEAKREPLTPETVALIWVGMAFALLLALLLGGLHWAGKRASAQPAAEPVRDRQEWSSYPQPGDKI